MKEENSLSIIIPVYNEATTLKKILDKVYNYKLPHIRRELIIVESNSTDGSRQIVESFARGKSDVKLILEEKPAGKGHAVRAGISKSTGEIIMIQDADLEYKVSDYPRLLKPIIDGETDFVLGSRHLDHSGKYSWDIRKFKEKKKAFFMNLAGLAFHTFFNLIYHTNISDPTTMYKIFKRKCLDRIHLKGNYFDLDWEIITKLTRLGYKPIEVPVHYSPRGFDEGKKIKIMRDGPRYVKTIIENRLLPIDKL